MKSFLEPKQHFFLYDRKEMILLVFLGMMISFFTFTLGIHLGKNTRLKKSEKSPYLDSMHPLDDQSPSLTEFTEKGRGIETLLEESLNAELRHEVQSSGIQFDHRLALTLPELTKAETSNSNHQTQLYSLQVGSYPTQNDALNQIKSLKGYQLRPVLQEIQIKEKGKWYRVYLKGYPTRDQAKLFASQLQKGKIIHSYIIIKEEVHE